MASRPVDSAPDGSAGTSKAASVPHLGASTGSDEDLVNEDKHVYTSGIKMRDLGDVEVHQFPGLRRMHWW